MNRALIANAIKRARAFLETIIVMARDLSEGGSLRPQAVTAGPREPARCLNCGGPLGGPFCSSCGQRAVPPNPTVAELTGDAWHELSGYDGRVLATIRGLLQPGKLTTDYVSGRRAHYLPPLRVYLAASVLYFVIAAAAPVSMGEAERRQVRTGGVRIEVTGPASFGALSEEDRAELRARLDESPRILRPMLQSILDDPAAFRARVFITMPRVLFGMLPIFAAIVSLFYRRRPFPTALVFAVHLHSFAFVTLALSELAKFTNLVVVAVGAGILAMLCVLVYTLVATRRVYGGSWPVIAAKTAGIGVLYLVASIPAFAIILAWASI
jgi:hypothetical protein